MQRHYEDKVNYLVKTKDYVEQEVEDWKDKYEKLESVSQELEIKYKSTNDSLLNRHEELMKAEQANKKYKQYIEEL